MPSLIDLRRRIRAVKSTQQITKAMKTVSSSKLRRAQERMLAARPMTEFTVEILRSLATRVDSSVHPLLEERPPNGRDLLVVVTADKGLCGSFNTNVLKGVGAFLASRPAGTEVSLVLLGRKGWDMLRRRGFRIAYQDIGFFSKLDVTHAQAAARAMLDEFTSGRVNAVHVVSNRFKSVMQQEVVTRRLLPIPHLDLATTGPIVDYLYEPDPRIILDRVLPRLVEQVMFQLLLESAAAEHAARMAAMDAATRNSTEMIENLTLYMNKVRQAQITREIIEVVSGAEAL